MFERLAVIFGAGAVGFPWLCLSLVENIPPEIFGALPMAAKILVIVACVLMMLGMIVCLIGTIGTMLFGRFH